MDPVTIGALAGLAGGILQNRSARGIARDQMSFQERMSSTAYQRAMADMRAAGLNPILAYQQGGASTPGGASAPVVDVVSSARAGATQARELKLLQSQIRKVDNEAGRVAVMNATDHAMQEYYIQQRELARRQAISTAWQSRLFEQDHRVKKMEADWWTSELGKRAFRLRQSRESLLGGGSPIAPFGLPARITNIYRR